MLSEIALAKKSHIREKNVFGYLFIFYFTTVDTIPDTYTGKVFDKINRTHRESDKNGKAVRSLRCQRNVLVVPEIVVWAKSLASN